MRKLSAKSCVAGSAVFLRLRMECSVERKTLVMRPRKRFWRRLETFEDFEVKPRFRRGFIELPSISASPGSVAPRFEVNQHWTMSRKRMRAVSLLLWASHQFELWRAPKSRTLFVARLTVCR